MNPLDYNLDDGRTINHHSRSLDCHRQRCTRVFSQFMIKR